MKKWLLALVILGALIAAVSVGRGHFSKSQESAERAVEVFHAKYNTSKFAEIFNCASSELQKTSAKSTCEALLLEMRVKFGAHKSSIAASCTVNTDTSGTKAVLTFNSTFEKGTCREQFSYTFNGDEAELLGYQVSAPFFFR